jgi:transglutaminase-like putative cysteine protease
MLTAPPPRTAPDGGWTWRSPATARTPQPAARPAGDQARPGATAALALLTAASAAGLFRVFSTRGWVGPVLVTILAVHLLGWALRRMRIGSLAAVPAVVATIALMAAWTVLGRYTTYGVPTPWTWDQAARALGDLGNEISSMIVPVVPTRAFDLVAVAGAGLAAALGDWAAFRWKMPLAALIPALTVFILCATSGQGRGRGTVVAIEVAAMCAFLLVERASGDGQVWFAGIRSGTGAWAVAIGGVATAAAVVAAVGISPALAARDGSGVLGWRSGLGPDGGARVVPNPLVDFQTHLLQYANTPVFRVSSSVPSYWRLTSLDTFDGTTWVSSGSYSGFGNRLPGAVPVGAAVRTVRATFQIQALDSVWLPAQFNPIAVQGVRHVTYDQASNSLLTAQSTSDRLQYSVTSYQYLDTLSAAALQSAPSVSKDPGLAAYLQLPPSLAPAIRDLATALTRGLTTEYAKALAIQNYLLGPQFTYSLDPQTDGSGDQAIYNFLFSTRTGYCQQFAGAYAVLARAAGLPTRLAVGFVTGQAAGGDTYQVHDKDAHTWPEVYFGPRYGWVPFEPTKGFQVPGTSGYDTTGGTSTGPSPVTPVTSPTTVAGSTPADTANTPGAPHHGSPTTLAPVTAAHGSGSISAWWLVVPALLAAWLAVNGIGPVLLRRIRRRQSARAGTEAVVLNAWAEVASELLWLGIRRRPDETDDEFAQRASLALSRLGLDGAWTYGGIDGLAAMARRASFAPSVPDGLGEQAVVAAGEVVKRLASLTPRRSRWARMWSPPPGTWRRVAVALRPQTGSGPAPAPH